MIEQDQQEESDFEGLQEEIDDLDDNISGEDEMFIELSDEQFEKTKAELTQKINQNDSLAKWERTLLLFELDLAQVGWDLRKMQYEDNISTDVQRRIETLLASGRPQALPTIYEYYRRRQESALNISLKRHMKRANPFSSSSHQKKVTFPKSASQRFATRYEEEYSLLWTNRCHSRTLL